MSTRGIALVQLGRNLHPYTLGAHIENLTGTNASGFTGTGNSLDNVITGAGGNDTLTGGAGADIFVFKTTLGATNVDTVTDFAAGTDKLHLDDAVFSGIGSLGALGTGAFVTGTAAADADDRIIYNSATGQLYFDADGNGAGAKVLFATLTGAPVISASDFLVI